MRSLERVICSVVCVGAFSCAAGMQLLASAGAVSASKGVTGVATAAATSPAAQGTSSPSAPQNTLYGTYEVHVVSGCLLFGGPSTVLTGLTGDGRAIDLGGGDYGWIFATAQPEGSLNPFVRVSSQQFGGHCKLAWGSDVTPTPVLTNTDPNIVYGPLDGVRVGGKSYLYFAKYERDARMPFGLRLLGFGVAPEGVSGSFEPPEHLLFGPERPSFGTSIVPWGDTMYLFGCRSDAALLSGDCFLSRVANDKLTDENAYDFMTRDALWSETADDASPVLRASPAPSVTFDAASGEFWMTYVPMLGSHLLFRRAPAIQGPWSGPIDLGSCDLPLNDSQSFCTAALQHPEGRNVAANTLSITYGIGTLSSNSVGLRTSMPAAYWTRSVDVPVPAR